MSYFVLDWFMLGLFWEARLFSCKFFFNNRIENLIYITFVHIYHVLKIENHHIHNRKNFTIFLENKCITSWCSKSNFLWNTYPSLLKKTKIGLKIDSWTTLVRTLPSLLLVVYLCLGLWYCLSHTCPNMSKAREWGTFSKCRVKLGYHLNLGPLFWECTCHGLLPYTLLGLSHNQNLKCQMLDFRWPCISLHLNWPQTFFLD
jgi:hypothetical protein